MQSSWRKGLLVLLLIICSVGAAIGPTVTDAEAANKTLARWQYEDEGFNTALQLQRLYQGFNRGFKCHRLSPSSASCTSWTDHWIYPAGRSGDPCSVCHKPKPGKGGQGGKPYIERVWRIVSVWYVGQHYRVWRSGIFFKRM